jgi:hypothetical protein
VDLSFNQAKLIRVKIPKPRFAVILSALSENHPVIIFLVRVFGSRKYDSFFVHTILVTNIIADFEDPHSTHRILTRVGFLIQTAHC